MLKEEFKTWPVNSLPNITLIIIGMHVTNLDYLENKPFCFTELLNGGIEKLNRMLVRLDTATVIPETDNKYLLDLIDLEVEWINKKEKKAKRHRQRKINLA